MLYSRLDFCLHNNLTNTLWVAAFKIRLYFGVYSYTMSTVRMGNHMTAECDDEKCFVHGSLSVRGGRLTGKVVSTKGKHTVVIERSMINYISKYKRWAREHSRISAHNPPCISAKPGNEVRIGETRKISKTKSWTVLQILGSGEVGQKKRV